MNPSLEKGYDPTFSQIAFGPCALGRRNPLGETVGMNYLTGFVADAPGLAKIQPTASLGVTFAILRMRRVAVEDAVAGVPVPNDRSVDRSK